MAQITQTGPELYVVPTGHLKTEWRVPPRYTPQSVLGTGVYGTVVKAFDNVAQKLVAIKRIPKDKLCKNDSEALRALRQVTVLRRLKHPNIKAVRDAFEPVVGADGLIHALFVPARPNPRLCEQRSAPVHAHTPAGAGMSCMSTAAAASLTSSINRRHREQLPLTGTKSSRA